VCLMSSSIFFHACLPGLVNVSFSSFIKVTVKHQHVWMFGASFDHLTI
jgi:hypothetical protein